jgi:hypothetical protein
MEITSKEKNYELLRNGFLGNRLRFWDSHQSLLKSDYTGTVSMRYKGTASNFYAYEVKIKDIQKMIYEWTQKGADKNLIIFNESAPDKKLLIQGEIMHGAHGYYLFYSTEKKKMREALKTGRHAYGLAAVQLIKMHIDPQSFNDLLVLLELFPEHVVEFSTYSIDLGNIPGRNTVIWEVRKY